MKPITKLIYALFLTLFVVVGCKKDNNNNDDEHNEKKKKFCYKYQGRPDIALTYSELTAMLNQYDATKRGALQEAFSGDHRAT